MPEPARQARELGIHPARAALARSRFLPESHPSLPSYIVKLR
jgi:hypothetical protein